MSLSRRPEPPNAWLAAVRLLLPVADREESEGDLIELWSLRRARSTRWLAVRFWLDAISIAINTWTRPGPLGSVASAPIGVLANVGLDVRLAWRILFRRPAFAAVAIATLTFGIGASTAIFTIADRTLVQPLPYPAPDRIVVLDPFAVVIQSQPGGVAIQPAEVKRSREFSALGFYESGGLDLDESGGPVRLQAAAADSGFFQVLGVAPLVGRAISRQDDAGARVVVLGFDAWRRYFNEERSVLGRSVRLSGQSFTVIGVMPRLFAFPEAADVWVPPASDKRMTGGGMRARAIGRLADAVSIPQAAAMLANVKEAAFGERQVGPSPSMSPLQRYAASRARPTLLFLVGLVSLLLAASSASVASLLLSRLTLRLREMRVRSALGASRVRLVRQVVIESLVIAALGSAGGTVLAIWIVRTFSASMPVFVPGVDLAAVDGRLLAMSAAVSVLSSAFFSLAPVAGLNGKQFGDIVRLGVSVPRRPAWLSSSLLTSQIAIALILLVATSTALGMVVRLTRTELGLHNRAAVTFEVTLPASTYASPAAVASFTSRLETTLQSLPGVRAVGVTDFAPGSVGSKTLAYLQMVDHPKGPTSVPTSEPHGTMLVATAGYFRAVGVPLLAGRFFEPAEGRAVVVLNESAARTFDSNIARVVGKRLVSPDAEVIGVVGDVQLDADVPQAIRAMTAKHVYQPLSQRPPTGTLAVAVDMAGDFAAVVTAVRRGLRDVDPTLAIYSVSRVGDLPARIFASERLTLVLGSFFSLVVLGLAAIGLYGVLAQLVTERTREIGIRMALGANRTHLRAGIVWIAFRLTLMGIGIGSVLAVAAWRVASASVPNLDAPNIQILMADVLVLLAVSALAAWIPARRASAIDPVAALRAD